MIRLARRTGPSKLWLGPTIKYTFAFSQASIITVQSAIVRAIGFSHQMAFGLLAAAPKKGPAPATVTKPKELSLVRVNVTGQPYDYVRPWQKRAPFQKRALGAVLPQGRVLVTADLPAYAHKGTRIDITASSIGDARGDERGVVVRLERGHERVHRGFRRGE